TYDLSPCSDAKRRPVVSSAVGATGASAHAAMASTPNTKREGKRVMSWLYSWQEEETGACRSAKRPARRTHTRGRISLTSWPSSARQTSYDRYTKHASKFLWCQVLRRCISVRFACRWVRSWPSSPAIFGPLRTAAHRGATLRNTRAASGGQR